MSLTEHKLKLIINKNDYDKLENILEKNQNYIISDDLIYYTISKKHTKCFDILLNYANINIDFHLSYSIALKIYNDAKNENNKYYISKLLDKNLDINGDILSRISNYDMDIFNKILNMHINDYNYIEELLNYLSLYNSYVFIDLFNKILTKEQQLTYVKGFYSEGILCCDNHIVFDYLMNSKEFNYKAINSDKEYIINNGFTFLNGSKKHIKIYLDYLLKNPITINEDIMHEFININFFMSYYNGNKFINYSLNNKYKNKCIINSPKINLIKISNTFPHNCPYFDNIYILYNLGLDINVYDDLTKEDLISYINNYNMVETYGEKYPIILLIFYVMFANLIEEPIPEHLVDTINNICNNSKLLNEKYDFTKNYNSLFFNEENEN